MGTTRESSALAVAQGAIDALGCGFDVTANYRLKYCKCPVVQLPQTPVKDMLIPGGITIFNVPRDITCDKGEMVRFTSEVMEFQQMSQLFNKNSSIEGKIPLGYFNAMFDLSGSWQDDATQTKSLAFDGFFVTLYKLQLSRINLVLREEVLSDIPSMWDPKSLAQFIEKYGTHIIVAVNIGGQDVLYLKESSSSSLSAKEIRRHLKLAGDQCFTDGSNSRLLVSKENEMYSLTSQASVAHMHSAQLFITNKDVTIIGRRRGGNPLSKSHNEWQDTVSLSPDAISMSFVPITSLITGVSGTGFLQHAINLYLRYKPPVEDLRYFLDFQVPRQWIPEYNELPLGLLRIRGIPPSLQFSLMGPRLFVNTTEVAVSRRPVTGIRLYLEGKRSNRLAIHLQHLSVLPRTLDQFWNEEIHIEEPRWHGSEGSDKKWFEPVQWKSFSCVCTQPIKFQGEWKNGKDGVFVVTGAKLEVKSYGLKNVLHLRLLFTKIPGCMIQASRWDQPPASQKSNFFSSITSTFSSTAKAGKRGSPAVLVDSAVFPGGPPKPVQSSKLLKFVDMTELTRGPQDIPGHWIVTAAKLDLDSGKISMRVKYSLLSFM